MSETPFLVFYALFTGPENPQSQTPLYDALTYIITNFSDKKKLWKKHSIPLKINKIGRIDKIISWIHHVQSFLQTLPLQHILTLYAYTTPLYQNIQHFKCLQKIKTNNPEQNKIPVFEFLRHVSKTKLSRILPKEFMIRFQHLENMPWIIFHKEQKNKKYSENHHKLKELRLFEKDLLLNPQIMHHIYKAGVLPFKNKMDQRILFYPQIQACLPHIKTLNDLTHQLANITCKQWKCIYQKYITDLDDLFDQIPPLFTRAIVYRGEKKTNLCLFPIYKSTTLSRKQAADFGKVRQIVLEKGSHVIPLFLVSRYFVELEILVP